METTFVMVKPLGLQNFLLEILGSLRSLGTIEARRLVPTNRSLIAQHYAEHEGKPFYDRLVNYYGGETVMALRVTGPDIIARTRAVLGPSDPRKADPSQIRYLPLTKWRDGKDGWTKIELCTSGIDNLVHASDSPEAAERELSLWGI